MAWLWSAHRATTKHTNTPVPLLIREKENYAIDVICANQIVGLYKFITLMYYKGKLSGYYFDDNKKSSGSQAGLFIFRKNKVAGITR